MYPKSVEKILDQRMCLNLLKARIVKGNYRNMNGVSTLLVFFFRSLISHQIIRDMELVWNMPIHLLSPDSDSKTHSDAMACHKHWREFILPSLAKASHREVQLFMDIAQECEAEQIAVATRCKELASQNKSHVSSKSKGHFVNFENHKVSSNIEDRLLLKGK
jgi:hypothetical protein